jgi:hypothetical protein
MLAQKVQCLRPAGRAEDGVTEVFKHRACVESNEGIVVDADDCKGAGPGSFTAGRGVRGSLVVRS